MYRIRGATQADLTKDQTRGYQSTGSTCDRFVKKPMGALLLLDSPCPLSRKCSSFVKPLLAIIMPATLADNNHHGGNVSTPHTCLVRRLVLRVSVPSSDRLCSLMTRATSVAWEYWELPQAIICRPDRIVPDLHARLSGPPEITELLAFPERRQVVGPRLLRAAAAAPSLGGRVLLRRLLERGWGRPLELPPQLGLLVLGEPRRVGGAADGLAVGAHGLVQAALEHVDELALEPGQVAPGHADHGAGDDLAHVARGVVHLEHAHGLLGEDVALPLRQLQRAADVLAGLGEEAGQGELVVQLVEERWHVGFRDSFS